MNLFSHFYYKNVFDVINLCNFNIIKEICDGEFSEVILAEKIDNKKIYIIKILKYTSRISLYTSQSQNIFKLFRNNINNPFLVNLDFLYIINKNILYFYFEFIKGGDIIQYLSKDKKFEENRTKFYIACIILGLGFLHSKHFFYIDLKLKNLLLDEHGYCKLTLGEFKKDQNSYIKTKYFYTNIIQEKINNFPNDWRSLGIITYEMLYGFPPIYKENNKIIKDKLVFKASSNVSKEAKDFISKLLDKDRNSRLGSKGDSIEVMGDLWFKGMNWSKLMNQKIEAPFLPNMKEIDLVKTLDE